MRFFVILACILTNLSTTIDAGASPFLLVNGGINGRDNGSVGIEIGGTQAIMNLLPLSAELSLKSTFDAIPSNTNSNMNKLNEPYTTKKLNIDPEIGYLFKSGVNLNRSIPNLTLQVGGGYALQKVINLETGMASGTHWQQTNKATEVLPIGYAGILYRVNSVCITVGYNVLRGAVVGIGRSW
jgi:hypothetical protein